MISGRERDQTNKTGSLQRSTRSRDQHIIINSNEINLNDDVFSEPPQAENDIEIPNNSNNSYKKGTTGALIFV